MEPNKFENDFRQKLNSRTLNPTENSWDRLDAMLTVTENKTPKRRFGWMYYAASILILISVSAFFYNQKTIKNADQNNNSVVESNPIKKSEKNSIPIESQEKENIIPNQRTNQIAQTNHSKHIEIKSKKQNSIINQKTTVLPEVKNEVVIAQSATKKEEPSIGKAVVTITPDLNLNKTGNLKINPNTLLNQVNVELEQSFRETRLEKIKRNFQTIKVAIATRNQE